MIYLFHLFLLLATISKNCYYFFSGLLLEVYCFYFVMIWFINCQEAEVIYSKTGHETFTLQREIMIFSETNRKYSNQALTHRAITSSKLPIKQNSLIFWNSSIKKISNTSIFWLIVKFANLVYQIVSYISSTSKKPIGLERKPYIKGL